MTLTPSIFWFLYSVDHIKTGLGFVVFIITLLAITFSSLIPVFALSVGRVDKKTYNNTMIAGYIFAIAVIITTEPNISKIVVIATLKTAGIINPSPKTYVMTKTFPSFLFTPQTWGRNNIIKREGYTLINASSALTLGNMRLLCPINGENSFSKSLNEYIRNGYDNFFDDNTNRVKEVIKRASECIPVYNISTYTNKTPIKE